MNKNLMKAKLETAEQTIRRQEQQIEDLTTSNKLRECTIAILQCSADLRQMRLDALAAEQSGRSA